MPKELTLDAPVDYSAPQPPVVQQALKAVLVSVTVDTANKQVRGTIRYVDGDKKYVGDPIKHLVSGAEADAFIAQTNLETEFFNVVIADGKVGSGTIS